MKRNRKACCSGYVTSWSVSIHRLIQQGEKWRRNCGDGVCHSEASPEGPLESRLFRETNLNVVRKEGEWCVQKPGDTGGHPKEHRLVSAVEGASIPGVWARGVAQGLWVMGEPGEDRRGSLEDGNRMESGLNQDQQTRTMGYRRLTKGVWCCESTQQFQVLKLGWWSLCFRTWDFLILGVKLWDAATPSSNVKMIWDGQWYRRGGWSWLQIRKHEEKTWHKCSSAAEGKYEREGLEGAGKTLPGAE